MKIIDCFNYFDEDLILDIRLATLFDYVDKFKYKEVDKELKRKVVFKESEIINSLYSSAINVGIQPNVIIDFARIYGFQIDFQRDIWKNDRFQIIYETFLDSNQKVLDTGNILYANF